MRCTIIMCGVRLLYVVYNYYIAVYDYFVWYNYYIAVYDYFVWYNYYVVYDYYVWCTITYLWMMRQNI